MSSLLRSAKGIRIPAWLMQMSLFNRIQVLMTIEICRATLAMSQNPMADPERLHSCVAFTSGTVSRFAVMA